MKIQRIIHYDPQSQEADLLVSDGRYEVVCFAHPYRPDQSVQSMNIIDPLEIQRATELEISVNPRNTSPYNQRIVCFLSDLKKGNLEIGELKFQIFPFLIPKDLKEGELISLEAFRVDAVLQ